MPETEKRQCKGTAKSGKPCGARPLKPGTTLGGVAVKGDHCRAHDPDLPDSARIQGAQPGAGRPPKPRIVDVLRERIEGEIDEWLAPFYEGRGATRHLVVGNGPTAHLEEVPDIPTRMAASREVIDRVHGKPRQTTEITGADGGPLKMTFAELATAADGDDDS